MTLLYQQKCLGFRVSLNSYLHLLLTPLILLEAHEITKASISQLSLCLLKQGREACGQQSVLSLPHPHESRKAKVKIAIESFAEDQYDISVSTGQKADLDGFIKQLRSEQIQLEVLSKQDSIIMCSEFNDLPAAVKCEDRPSEFSNTDIGASNTDETGLATLRAVFDR